MNITEILLINSINSPYERIMKDVPRYMNPAPQKNLEEPPCALIVELTRPGFVR